MHTLDDAQAAAILAGLRLLQRQGCPADLEEVATNCGRFGLPGNAFLDALCEQLNAWGGEISNWNMGVDDASGGRVPPETRSYTVTHLHPTAAIRIEIGTGARLGRVGDDTWIVDTELSEGRPVVRFYQPGQDEPAGTFRFAAVAAPALDGNHPRACRSRGHHDRPGHQPRLGQLRPHLGSLPWWRGSVATPLAALVRPDRSSRPAPRATTAAPAWRPWAGTRARQARSKRWVRP